VEGAALPITAVNSIPTGARDLDVVETAGWDPQNGLPVNGIPASVSSTEQTLQIAVPWPAPAPHTPLYIWLRGETTGRRTRLTE
jgi:hypothetical protein